jgi:hypothetical protein
VGEKRAKKNRKILRILLFKFGRNVRLMTAALGGSIYVSPFGR